MLSEATPVLAPKTTSQFAMPSCPVSAMPPGPLQAAVGPAPGAFPVEMRTPTFGMGCPACPPEAATTRIRMPPGTRSPARPRMVGSRSVGDWISTAGWVASPPPSSVPSSVVTTKFTGPATVVAVTVAVEKERPPGILVARKLVLALPSLSVEVTCWTRVPMPWVTSQETGLPASGLPSGPETRMVSGSRLTNCSRIAWPLPETMVAPPTPGVVAPVTVMV